MIKNQLEYYKAQSEYWFNECSKFIKQRNELIDDMKEIKIKAQAFDEIERAYWKSESSERFGDMTREILIKILELKKSC